MINEENVIRSVVQFVQKISDLRKTSLIFREASLSSLPFFRGQANHNWSLTPRLYREGLFNKERALISEFIRVAPEEFKNMTQFDILIKMQHYGLPTRLLDTTLNPLVSLFFACFDKKEIDNYGAVYIFRNLPFYRQEMGPIKFILKYIFEYSGYPLNTKKFLESTISSRIFDDYEPITHTMDNLIQLLNIPVHPVIPSLNNPRILSQDGAFFLFGMNSKPSKFKLDKNTPDQYLDYTPFEFNSIKTASEFCNGAPVFFIPPESKGSILEDLEFLGISRNRMFPELEYQADFITQQIKKDIIRSSTSSIIKPAQS